MNQWEQQRIISERCWDALINEVSREIARGVKPKGYEPPIEKLRREEAEKRKARKVVG